MTGILFIAVLSGWLTASSGASSPVPEDAALTEQADTPKDVAAEGNVDLVTRARSFRANEMGQVLVLMYHLIGHTDSQYNRTPEQFRQDIADLKAAGYYPINVRDLAAGHVDIPAGTSPVVLTFDDSSGGQYRILSDGRLDPDCAVVIMVEEAGRGDWACRATFFPLLEVDAPDRIVFGQPSSAEEKLRRLVSWGFEVGSHTVTHLDLEKASALQAKKQLYQSKEMLEQMIGDDYEVTSLAAPFGAYPAQASILQSGEYDGRSYGYQAALRAAGGPSFSPFSSSFRAYHIPRIQVSGASLKDALTTFEALPKLRYVSDGDPATICMPADIDVSLGSVRPGPGQEVVRY